MGFTDRDPFVRAAELRTTGVPSPFVVEYAFSIYSAEQIERALHRRLHSYRLASDREFFTIPTVKIISIIREEHGNDIAQEYCRAENAAALKEVEGNRRELLRASESISELQNRSIIESNILKHDERKLAIKLVGGLSVRTPGSIIVSFFVPLLGISFYPSLIAAVELTGRQQGVVTRSSEFLLLSIFPIHFFLSWFLLRINFGSIRECERIFVPAKTGALEEISRTQDYAGFLLSKPLNRETLIDRLKLKCLPSTLLEKCYAHIDNCMIEQAHAMKKLILLRGECDDINRSLSEHMEVRQDLERKIDLGLSGAIFNDSKT